MNMWELRETKPRDERFGRRGSSMGRRDESPEDWYDCGYEDGYRKAMKEAKRYYEHRDADSYDEKRY